jgi:hypothetical protein
MKFSLNYSNMKENMIKMMSLMFIIEEMIFMDISWMTECCTLVEFSKV